MTRDEHSTTNRYPVCQMEEDPFGTHLHSNCGSLGYADSLNTDALVEVVVEGTEGRVDDSRGELDMWFNEGKKMRELG